MARKHKCPEFENHERWLVSYADMLTLLFAVFVVLYSLNVAGSKAEEQAAGSMQESFNTPLEDIPVDRIQIHAMGMGIFAHFKGDTAKESPIEKMPEPTGGGPRVIDQDLTKTRQMLEQRLYGDKRFRSSTGKGNARIVDVARTRTGLRFKMAARYFYDAGSTKIKKRSRREFDEVIEILKNLGRPVTIEGHTDSLPAKGRYTNWELSSLRATEVVRYMIEKHNFPRSLLTASGLGDVRPVASNATKSGRALNRRIEIQVHYDSDQVDP